MNSRPLIIAHRGASADAPENTLAAFRLALNMGADGVEFDVRLSLDGVPVVVHDPSLRRTAGRSGQVSELTAAELSCVDVGTCFDNKLGRLGRARFAGASIPTLAEVLSLFESADRLIYLELKAGRIDSSYLVPRVCDVIARSSLLDRIVVKSFKLNAIADAKRSLPALKTAALFQPSPRSVLRPSHIVRRSISVGAAQISVHRSLATKRLAGLAKAAGLPLVVWTVDDPLWLAKAREMELHAVITNDPAKLLARRLML